MPADRTPRHYVNTHVAYHATSPVREIPDRHEGKAPEEGVALCLSGGGYRAMLFHLGALWRLNELGYLKKLARVSSVSGGSIAAGVLGYAWDRLVFDEKGRASQDSFRQHVVEPLFRLGGKNIDVRSIVAGMLPCKSAAGCLEAHYEKHLFHQATLAALPVAIENEARRAPRFIINATSVQTGALFRFSREYLADWHIGIARHRQDIPLARAVAASSAFPPVLSPLTMKLNETDFEPEPGTKHDLDDVRFKTEQVLTDGGVYDNLGLETAYKRYKTILCSDAGQALEVEVAPAHDWIRHGIRTSLAMFGQVCALRKRQLISAFEQTTRTGAYWGIASDVASYQHSKRLVDPIIVIGHDDALKLAATPTRLKAMPEPWRWALVDWGYVICDTAMRAHADGVERNKPALLPSGKASDAKWQLPDPPT